MDPFRLKLKVGPHEFEAEGDQRVVEQQLAVWKELIASASVTAQPPIIPTDPQPPAPGGQPPLPPPGGNDLSRPASDKLFRHDGRIVSLTMLPNGGQREADALLLLLLGQKIYTGADLVTGQQLGDGLKQSGLTVERVDRGWGEHMDVNVVRVGSHRGVKYRLTNPGFTRATELARGLIAMVP